jgi:hypothetical protein
VRHQRSNTQAIEPEATVATIEKTVIKGVKESVSSILYVNYGRSEFK